MTSHGLDVNTVQDRQTVAATVSGMGYPISWFTHDCREEERRGTRIRRIRSVGEGRYQQARAYPAEFVATFSSCRICRAFSAIETGD
jgi:hypothetical protein